MTRFVMATQGSGGDVLPFVAVGAELIRRGHQVVLVSHASAAAAARRGGLRFLPADSPAEEEQFLTVSPRLLRVRSTAELIDLHLAQGGRARWQRELEAVLAAATPDGTPTVLVGRHTTADAATVAAELTGLPLVWLALAPHQLLTEPVARVHRRSGLGEEVERLRAGYGLAPARGHDRVRPDRVLGLWPRWFDEPAPSPGHPLLTGFVLGDELGFGGELRPTGRRRSADDPAPVVVTGGTGRMLDPDYYPAALDAVADCGHPVTVVAPVRELLPPRLPEGVQWRARLDFPSVLRGAAALVHHGGIGTVARALAEGVPQVILAAGADRPDNSRRLERLGLARVAGPARWPTRAGRELVAAAVAEQQHHRDQLQSWAAREPNGPVVAAEALELVPARRRQAPGPSPATMPATVSEQPTVAGRVGRLSLEQARRLAALVDRAEGSGP